MYDRPRLHLLKACEYDGNHAEAGVMWRFTTCEARRKLARLKPELARHRGAPLAEANVHRSLDRPNG